MKRIVLFTVTFNVLILCIMLLFSQNVYAYLDPGTGSYILQMLIATVVGGLFVAKLYFQKLKGFLEKIFSKGKNDEQFKE